MKIRGRIPECPICDWEMEWCDRCEEYFCLECDGGHAGCEYGDDDECVTGMEEPEYWEA